MSARSAAVAIGLRRVTGMGIAGSLALALLAGGCVLAATAGPREAQATGLLGARQTMNGLPQVDRTIAVSTTYVSVSVAFNGIFSKVSLIQANLDDITSQLRRDFGTGPLPLAPRSADWVAMTSTPRDVLSTLPALHGIPAQAEVTYPYPVAGHMRLVAGSMPDTAPKRAIQVVVTAQMASTWGLRPGSVVAIIAPLQTTISGNEPRRPSFKLNLDITGIVEPTDPDSSFWKADPLLAAPNLYVSQSKLWEGAFIADPGEIAMMQKIFGQAGLGIRWEFPVATTGLRAQAPALYSELKQFTIETPELTGLLAPMSSALSTTSAMLEPLATLVAASNGVNVLLWMVYVGLAVAGIVMMLLAARMVAARRAAEMAVRRARGASTAHLFWRGSFGVAVAGVPAAVLAWALAVWLVPGSGPAGWVAWWPGIATLAVALVAPGLVAAWQHRLPRRRRARGRERWRRRWATRTVFEVTACAAAIGGVIVLRHQGAGGDLYTSAAPLLVAVPAVIVVLRLYQLVLRGLARASARQRGVIGFLGLTRAAQSTATLALPAITLVLTLTMAAFTIMVRDAVVRGEIAASWQETGADVAITYSPGSTAGPSAVRAFAAVPGVQHAATALELTLNVTGGEQVTVIAVDPASYAALVASTEGYSPVDPALLTEAPGQAGVPVLASAGAAAIFGRQPSVSIAAQQGLPALRVRVSGELQSTPALPAGGTFMVLPLSAIGGAGPPPVNVLLLTGPSIDIARLRAVQAAIPGSGARTITTRSQVLQELTGAPLQHGTFLIFTLAIVCALTLALAVMLLELALSTAERELTMAKLATMGLDEGQRVRLSVLETLPAIAASAVAAVACAIALPRLVAPAVNLSAFTQSQAPVPLRPDFASFLLPLAGLLVVSVVALAYEIRSWRGRVAVALRA
jgi:putative ABC transport system permease protein